MRLPYFLGWLLSKIPASWLALFNLQIVNYLECIGCGREVEYGREEEHDRFFHPKDRAA
jgi:hypothetical protein